ncbi:MAG: hypothetical protein ABH859_00060 [Pseudomonadota bacterium]
MRKLLLITLIMAILPVTTLAKKTTYIVTNHRLNYVKIEEVKREVAETRQMDHPQNITELQMRGILKSIKLNKKHLIGEKVKHDMAVLNEPAINFLAPALVKAFKEAKPNEEVVFSYLVKDPIFILRNDRINIAHLWVNNNELHIKFNKLYAKVSGDTDKKGYSGRAVSNARGLRLAFDIGPGQKMGISDPEELVVNLDYDFSKEKPDLVADQGEAENEVETAAVNSDANKVDAKERLQRLEELKKEKLITPKEYEQKRQEILNQL